MEIFLRFSTRRGKKEWIIYVRVIKSGRVEREFLGERKFELLLRGDERFIESVTRGKRQPAMHRRL